MNNIHLLVLVVEMEFVLHATETELMCVSYTNFSLKSVNRLQE